MEYGLYIKQQVIMPLSIIHMTVYDVPSQRTGLLTIGIFLEFSFLDMTQVLSRVLAVAPPRQFPNISVKFGFGFLWFLFCDIVRNVGLAFCLPVIFSPLSCFIINTK